MATIIAGFQRTPVRWPRYQVPQFLLNYTPGILPLRLLQIEMVELLRNLALWLPSGWRYLPSPSVRASCHPLPLGYGASLSLRRLVGTPRAYGRRRMPETLRKMEFRYPASQIWVGFTDSFYESIGHARSAYLGVTAQAKMCPTPRGMTHEAVRLVCIVISDRLPLHSFYADSPTSQIRDWGQIPDVVKLLERDLGRLEALQPRSLAVWHDLLSDVALARRYAQGLGLVAKPDEQDHKLERNNALARTCVFVANATLLS